MVFHPRQNRPWSHPRHWRRLAQGMSRRDFLRLSGGAGLAAFLAACAGETTTTTAPAGGGGTTAPETMPETETGEPQIVIGTPDNPAEQPIYADNPPIESGLEPEPGPLRVYNWADYIWPRVLKDFAAEYGVEFELSTFYNLEESIRKLRTGDVSFDVYFPTAENIGQLVAGKLLQPLNLDYIPNLSNVWPQLQDPFYDKGSRYTVPYTVYQTGIGWREDMVGASPETFEIPWDAFWDPANRGITGLYDDFRETIGVGLYHNGILDINTTDPADVEKSKNSLIEANEALDIKYSIDGAYIKIPEAKLGLHHAWSGDMAAAPYYAPKGVDPTPMRYLWPPKANASAGGYVSNDLITIPRNAEHPVLAHHFLNFMLSEKFALKNFSWVLYQPPQTSIDPDNLVAEGYIPDYLASTVVRPEDWELGQQPLQLPPEGLALWLDAWSQIRAGG